MWTEAITTMTSTTPLWQWKERHRTGGVGVGVCVCVWGGGGGLIGLHCTHLLNTSLAELLMSLSLRKMELGICTNSLQNRRQSSSWNSSHIITFRWGAALFQDVRTFTDTGGIGMDQGGDFAARGWEHLFLCLCCHFLSPVLTMLLLFIGSRTSFTQNFIDWEYDCPEV